MTDRSRRTFLTTAAAGLGALALGMPASGRQPQDGPFRMPTRRRAMARPFRFVFMPDIHLRHDLNAPRGFRTAINHALTLDPKPDFVVTGGDLTQNIRDLGPEEAEKLATLFRDLCDQHIDVPIYHSLGNHDSAGWRGGDYPTDHPDFAFGLLQRLLQLPELRYAFDWGQWRFIHTHNFTLTDGGSYVSEFDEECLAFIERELRDHPGRPFMLFGHFPPVSASEFMGGNATVGDDGRWRLGTARMTRNPIDLVKTIEKAGATDRVRAFVSGHIHRLDRIETLGLTMINSGSVSGAQWRGPDHEARPGFGVVDCMPDGEFRYRYVTFDWRSPLE